MCLATNKVIFSTMLYYHVKGVGENKEQGWLIERDKK